MKNQVCLFFYVNGQFLIHGCDLADAESYGDFLIYPGSHFEIWDRYYAGRYPVDYDFFPRGRVTYSKSRQTFQILSDRCIAAEMQRFAREHYDRPFTLGQDEHYQCRRCNKEYVI